MVQIGATMHQVLGEYITRPTITRPIVYCRIVVGLAHDIVAQHVVPHALGKRSTIARHGRASPGLKHEPASRTRSHRVLVHLHATAAAPDADSSTIAR